MQGDARLTPAQPYPIQTDSAAYTAVCEGERLHYGRCAFTIVARFANATEDSVFLQRSYPDQPAPNFSVSSDTTRSAYVGVGMGVGHDNQIAVAPGASRIDTLRVSGPSMWSSEGVPDGGFRGSMRLTYMGQSCQSEGGLDCARPNVPILSNKFQVRTDPLDF
jgi:hypothetical protein